jgi:hypothetical protein
MSDEIFEFSFFLNIKRSFFLSLFPIDQIILFFEHLPLLGMLLTSKRVCANAINYLPGRSFIQFKKKEEDHNVFFAHH